MMVHISSGNRRMSIPTFSIPSSITCPNATPLCSRYCYAKKAEKAWPKVLPSRQSNLNLTYSKDFVSIMNVLIKPSSNTYFRIHESGDFYNQEYLDKWIELVKLFPDKKFLAYTQMYDLDYSKKPDNLIIYWTIWLDSNNPPVNGLKAYVVDDGSGKIPTYPNTIKGHNCSKGHNKDITCDKCLYCFEGKGDVVFRIH